LEKEGQWYGHIGESTGSSRAKAYCSEGCSHQNFTYRWEIDFEGKAVFDASRPYIGAELSTNDKTHPGVTPYGHNVKLIAEHDELTEPLINYYKAPDLINHIYSTDDAFYALTNDGNVIYSKETVEGYSSAIANELAAATVVDIFSLHDAFAALTSDGNIITWEMANNRDDISVVTSELNAGITALTTS